MRCINSAAAVCIMLIVASCGGSGGSPGGDPIDPVVDEYGFHATGVCRHEALIASVIYEEAGYETRLTWGPSTRDDSYHIQTQVLIDGEWKWVKVRNKIHLDIGHQDDFDVEKYYDTDEVYDNMMCGVWY